MGNSTSRIVGCFAPFGNGDEAADLDFLEPLDEGLGHSFCYVRPVITDSPAVTPSGSERFVLDSTTLDGDTNGGGRSFRQEVVDDDDDDDPAFGKPGTNNFSETTFKSISGASVSANASAARTGAYTNQLFLGDAAVQEPAASFESTASFASIPLHPVPRGSAPLNGFMSGPLERAYASGPLDKGGGRGFMSGPLDNKGLFMSAPLDSAHKNSFSAPLSSYGSEAALRGFIKTITRPMKNAFSRTFARFASHAKHSNSEVQAFDFHPTQEEYADSRNLQWAHGKAGEDRIHVVLSEQHRWLFIGIYDGFSGPDAPDFLMTNLYTAIHTELQGLLGDYQHEFHPESPTPAVEPNPLRIRKQSDREEEEEEQEEPHFSECSAGRSQPRLQNDPLHTYFTHSDHQKLDDDVEKQSETKNSGSIQLSAAAANQDDGSKGHESVERGHAAAGPHTPPEKDHSFVSSTTHPGNGKKRMRLFQLLQMDLIHDYDRDFSFSDIGTTTMTSCSLRTGENEDDLTFGGRSLPASQRYSCSPTTANKATHSLRSDADRRDDDGASRTESNHLRQTAAIYPAANRHKMMMNRSWMGTKLTRFYLKHKSSRKKLFPWSYDWHRQHVSVDETSTAPAASIRTCKSGPIDHDAVLRAMSRALKTTEEAYTHMVEKTIDTNPELALMGSCVLVMLIKDQDVYVMNVGDSRVILAQGALAPRYTNPNPVKDDPNPLHTSTDSLVRVELDRISQHSLMHYPNCKIGSINKDRQISIYQFKLRAVQLSTDHCTTTQEEVMRIKAEHVDDPQAVFNDRVKGQLKVTRAFGAGFLKKPEFNEALLEMFRINYIGNSPYLSCVPSVLHHRLCASDRFLVLSSDGLYQYFSNEEVVSHIAWFMQNVPEGDPAQYLIAELLFRAAKKNRMDFHELLDIPHGDRRKYHDDVSVMVVSLEGRIWRSCG